MCMCIHEREREKERASAYLSVWARIPTCTEHLARLAVQQVLGILVPVSTVLGFPSCHPFWHSHTIVCSNLDPLVWRTSTPTEPSSQLFFLYIKSFIMWIVGSFFFFITKAFFSFVERFMPCRLWWPWIPEFQWSSPLSVPGNWGCSRNCYSGSLGSTHQLSGQIIVESRERELFDVATSGKGTNKKA